MERFVSPPLNALGNLRQPLTEGERLVLDFFLQNLPEKWEIYIQPHLNGLRPDFVLLNPDIGIAVYEIKDWSLHAMEYKVIPRVGRSPELVAHKDGKWFSLQHQNPVDKVLIYQQEILDLYCPRLNSKKAIAAVTAGVIMPFSSQAQVDQLFEPVLSYHKLNDPNVASYHPLVGRDTLEKAGISRVFPEAKRSWSALMSADVAKDLRHWLVEPDFAATQRLPLELDENQKRLSKTRSASGYRRIKGPAGSGKSLVLAARTAELLSQGKHVLVVTFNLTLLNYLQDLTVRCPEYQGRSRTEATWLNFHAWCKRVCIHSGFQEEYDALWKSGDLNQVLTNSLPALVDKALNENSAGVEHFDAVLVDEGQDFQLNWWNLLRRVCLPDGEMWLSADTSQDVYGTASAWTEEAMNHSGFVGRWARLGLSYRLPPVALRYAADFAQRYLPHQLLDLPDNIPDVNDELDFYPCQLRWVQVKSEHAAAQCIEEFRALFPKAEPDVLAITDVVFLCDSKQFGYNFVCKIGMKGVKCTHTFTKLPEEWKIERQRKQYFFMGAEKIKATTLHSFKGWESRALVIFVDSQQGPQAATLLYTGLTRLKRHVSGSFLTVVCADQQYRDYGVTWPEYLDLTVEQS
ncbi:DEAD/DEAH box helicase [Thiorhodovibrio frisius]|uniref:AAA family ATPase n=1 Tax=Thiorhodovibrio frisius TaxID=631362 RepID=UPI0005954771|nr:AAA family ATPase [Thiorhodovibrio frisius]